MSDSEHSEDSVSSKEDIEQSKRKCVNGTPDTKRIKIKHQEPKSKKRKNNLYKAPTAEELNNLRETENLYNSNLFRFQIDGLLEEIKVKEKYHILFNKWFEQFENFINNIPEYGELKLSQIVSKANKKSKLQNFINLLVEEHKGIFKSDQDVSIKFIKPEEYVVFGLHKINLAIGPQLTTNVNIVMPKSCFLVKDYLNNRYLVKREYYAAYICVLLRESKLFSTINYIAGNSTIETVPQISSNINIHFHITPMPDSFKLPRFVPNKNNVRADIYEHFDGINLDELKQYGTSFYNAIILHDLTLKSSYEYFEQFFKDLTSIRDGIKLLLVWLVQRNLCSQIGGFSYELLLNLLVYMIQKKKINQYMSSYQVVRNVWAFLSTSNWNECPISMCDISNETLQEFREHFDVVFLDNSGCYNLASFLNLDMYQKIRSEATLAVQFLDEVKFDTFKPLFLTKMEPELQYDALLKLQDATCFKKVYKTIKTSDRHNYMGFYKLLIINKIISVFKERLNKRIVNIVPIFCKNDDVATDLTFGITLNPEYAFSIIEKGPQSNTEDAFAFRNFWGTLSECRRFADGSICEAVYFKSNTTREKRQIFKRIIDFIVKDKFEIQDYKIFCDQFEDTLILKNFMAPFPVGTNEEASLKVITIFDELDAKIREFKLPLEIADLRGTSEIFCFTRVFPPIPTAHKCGKKVTSLKGDNIVLKKDCMLGVVPRYVEPIECAIQLGINSKWPKDIDRLRDIKTIYFLEMSKLLKQNNILSSVKPDHLDVLFRGLVFRFRLYHSKEVALLKKYKKPDGTTAYKDNEESLSLDRNLRILPKTIGALRGLHAQNNCYGVSTTLIKRWLRTQLIDDYHIPDIVISLLNAYLFLISAPFERPNLPQVAFLRFIKFIAGFDWNNQFIMVNFNNELSKEDIDNIQVSFEQNRQAYPLLHIVTPYDEGRSWFTKTCYKEILTRLNILAHEMLVIIQTNVLKHMDFFPIQQLFIPNTEGYDVLIHLKPHLNPLRYQQLDFTNSFSNTVQLQDFNEDEKNAIPVIDFNLATKYLHDLRESYGNLALFFYDSYGGNVIGVLWKPLKPKPFKASHVESGLQFKDGEFVLNTEVIIEDFYILGNDLVKKIEET